MFQLIKQFVYNSLLHFYPMEDNSSNDEDNIIDSIDPTMKRSTLYLIGKDLIEKGEKEKGIQYIKSSINKRYLTAVNYYCRLILSDKTLQKFTEAKYILKKFLKEEDRDIHFLYGKILKKEHKYHESIKYFRKSSKLGSPEAMYELGKLLLKGENIQHDENQAMKYFLMSKNKGYSKSDKYITKPTKKDGSKNQKSKVIFSIISLIIFGLISMKIKQNKSPDYLIINNQIQGIPDDQDQTNLYLKESADSGDVSSMFNYGCHLYEGKGTEVNKEEAAKYFKKAADNGVVEAMCNYGVMLKNGEGVEIDNDEGNKYIKMAADEGYPNALYFYGLSLENEHPSKIKECIKYYELAIEKGSIEAMYRYSFFLLMGNGVKKNLKKGNEFLKIVADKGYVSGILTYGVNLIYGNGIKRNKKEGLRYLKIGCEKGLIEAMFYYSVAILEDKITSSDEQKEAIKYIKIAIDHDHVKAMNMYGTFLLRGQNVEKNVEKAMHYLKMAADRGDIDSLQTYFSLIFEDDISNDISNKAMDEFSKMVNELNANAIYVYANFLLNVAKNVNKSIKYFKIGAELGEVNSMFQYSLMLYSGIYIQNNNEEAFILMKKAADLGHDDAKYMYDLMVKNIEKVDYNIQELIKYRDNKENRDKTKNFIINSVKKLQI